MNIKPISQLLMKRNASQEAFKEHMNNWDIDKANIDCAHIDYYEREIAARKEYNNSAISQMLGEFN